MSLKALAFSILHLVLSCNIICRLLSAFPSVSNPGHPSSLTPPSPHSTPLHSVLSALPAGPTLRTCLPQAFIHTFPLIFMSFSLFPTDKCPLGCIRAQMQLPLESESLCDPARVFSMTVLHHGRWKDGRLSSQTAVSWNPGSPAVSPNLSESLVSRAQLSHNTYLSGLSLLIRTLILSRVTLS